ncbi:AI-2E family transporter [Pseudaestuariivita sp.]|uniref:AI-2E family transporter n=1 Tax=Pseudaestuariivita sp. TaxID=2211669 RepID=UPI0040594C62
MAQTETGTRWASPTVVVVCLTILTILALIGGLRYASDFIAPIAFGLMVGVAASPAVTALHVRGVPRAAGAFFALILSAGLIAAVIVVIGPIVIDLVQRLPQIQYELERFLTSLSSMVKGVELLEKEIEQQLAETAEGDGGAMPGLADAVWAAPNFMAQTLLFAGTLFFFLLTRDEIYAAAPKYAVRLQAAEYAVVRYFVVVSVVNAGLGVATALAMTALGLSYPILWGLAAFLLNFMLYLGPIVMIAALSIGGIIAFPLPYALLPPAAFLTLNLIEAQFATPTIVGPRINTNPLVVFLAIIFGMWMWGPVGAIVALPLLVWTSAVIKG